MAEVRVGNRGKKKKKINRKEGYNTCTEQGSRNCKAAIMPGQKPKNKNRSPDREIRDPNCIISTFPNRQELPESSPLSHLKEPILVSKQGPKSSFRGPITVFSRV